MMSEADLPCDERRRVCDHPQLVEDEWVEAEGGPRVHLAADVDAASAEASLTHERIGRLQVGARRPVGAPARARPHRSPRQSGSV